jgi:hypothetical protein
VSQANLDITKALRIRGSSAPNSQCILAAEFTLG